MYKLEIDGVQLPPVYVAENNHDVDVARSNGLPYISWRGSKDMLIKLIFLPKLKKMFPYVKWDQLLGTNKAAKDDGLLYGKTVFVYDGKVEGECKIPIDEFAGDELNSVNIDKLADLKLLPKFMADIESCIKDNLMTLEYSHGWNRQQSLPIGSYGPGKSAANLIIVDVSYSIPFGIAATLLALCETMRGWCKADLIVTGGISLYFAYDDKLPSPKELRKMVPRANESKDFNKILVDHILGKPWDNVIVFGDNDTPSMYLSTREAISGTHVGKLWSYHTRRKDIAGYGEWIEELNIGCDDVAKDTSWCSCIKE